MAAVEAGALHELAQLYRRQGNPLPADEAFRAALNTEGERDHGAVAAYHVLVGDVDAAIRALEALVAAGEPRAWVASDPDYAALHGNPAFEALVGRPPS